MTPLARGAILLTVHTLVFTVAYGATGLALLWASCFLFEWDNQMFSRAQAFELDSAVLAMVTVVVGMAFLASSLVAAALTSGSIRRSRWLVCLGLGPTAFVTSNLAAHAGGRLGFLALLLVAAVFGWLANAASARAPTQAS